MLLMFPQRYFIFVAIFLVASQDTQPVEWFKSTEFITFLYAMVKYSTPTYPKSLLSLIVCARPTIDGNYMIINLFSLW